MGGQPGQLGDQLFPEGDQGQVRAHPGGLGDQPCVLGVGLPLAPEHARHPVHRPAGHIGDLLAGGDQHGQQQRRRRAGQIHRPAHLGSSAGRPGHQLLDGSLVVGHLLRPAQPALPIHRRRVMCGPYQRRYRSRPPAEQSSAFPCHLSQPMDSPASSSLNSDGPQQI
jgi:hypothetical protein